MRIDLDGEWVGRALRVAGALDGAVLDATGRLAGTTAGQGPDACDVLAGRAALVESFRIRKGVPVVGWGGPLTRVGRAVLARCVERETGTVVVLSARWRQSSAGTASTGPSASSVSRSRTSR